MKKLPAVLLLTLINSYMITANAHDTFLVFNNHYLQPESDVSAWLLNGTFEKSENSVAVDRFQDVRVAGPNQSVHKPEDGQWHLTEVMNELEFKTGKPGTYIAGASIKPRMIEMTGEEFDDYLKHDGVLDVLKARSDREKSDELVRERYSKHVKALFQVGEQQTGNFDEAFGYPIEIVPQQNPGSLSAGEALQVKVLFHGQPVNNQLLYASYAGHHGHDDDGHHVEAVQTRTDADGLATIQISKRGRWYVRLIHMTVSDEPDVDYESNWATLTFEIK